MQQRERASKCVSKSEETDQRKDKLQTWRLRLRNYQINQHEKGPREVKKLWKGLREPIILEKCEVKPTTLKRPSPGNGFGNHM